MPIFVVPELQIICLDVLCLLHFIFLLVHITILICKMKNYVTLYGPRWEQTCLLEFANNTGADQPAHARSLISAFVIQVLENTMSKLATTGISFF